MEASDVLPPLLLPQLVGLDLKLPYQLDGRHLLAAERHDLPNIGFITFCELYCDSYNRPQSEKPPEDATNSHKSK